MASTLTKSKLLRSFKDVVRWFKFQQRRSKYKQKWVSNQPKRTDTERALDNFDLFYKPVYEDLWPSIRISLLCKQKYCALVNNNVDFMKIECDMHEMGTYNIVQTATERLASLQNVRNSDGMHVTKTDSEENCKQTISPGQIPSIEISEKVIPRNSKGGSLDDIDDESDEETTIPSFIHYEKNTSLFNFVPTKKVYSKKEIKQREEEVASSHMDSSNIPIKVVQEDVIQIPNTLRVYTHNRGKIKDFPSPKSSCSDLLGYFLMDAASLLPVIALDLQSGDSVLDLCACPGGKTLAMLQTGNAETILCNDLSNSRMKRLKRIVEAYIPQESMSHIFISVKDGTKFSTPAYDKVLVDVPCNTDRHSLLNEENNLFKPGRSNERLKLPIVQRDLLIAGIKSSLVGGTIVYSTCTLSPAQNDGVVQSALEHIWQDTSMDVAVVDIGYLAQAFSDTFNFHRHTRYGQLVIPSLSANFGPMYICKLKKISDDFEELQ